jgi:hypothetical protein
MGTNRDQVADRVGDFLDRLIRKDVEVVQNPARQPRIPSFREFSEDEDAAEPKRGRAGDRRDSPIP